jgi:hypothetical protein
MATAFQYNSTTPTNSQGLAFNVEQLRDEILADVGITTELGQIVGQGTEDIEVRFIAALSGAEETALNAVVAAHIPTDFGIIVEGLTGEEGSGDVALASAELNWFDNENTIFESHTVQDVIEEISSLTWLSNVNPTVLLGAPILGDPGAIGLTGEQGEQGDQGTQGNTGLDGDDGPAGNTGVGGATGSDGLLGATGSAGNTGVAGATGEAAVGGLAGYEYAERTTELTTTSTTYVEYLKLTTSSLPAGDYRVGWFFCWAGEVSSRNVYVRLELDDTTQIDAVSQEPQQPTAEGSIVSSGFRKITLDAGVHTLDIDMHREPGQPSKSASLFAGRIELMRIL